jgi:hypothetical protein
VQGNYIGTDGNQLLTAGLSSNYAQIGVEISGASNNTVGGTVPGAGNVISNGDRGIQIVPNTSNTPPSGNFVQGNYIDTNAAGTAALGAVLSIGIRLGGNVSHTTIGGTAPSARNVIAAGDIGITLEPNHASYPTANVVQGNYIGTNAAGNAALVSQSGSIGVNDDGSSNTIGGVDTNAPGTPPCWCGQSHFWLQFGGGPWLLRGSVPGQLDRHRCYRHPTDSQRRWGGGFWQ